MREPDLYDIMKEWTKGKPFVISEWGGPGSYVMEVVCTTCHATLGNVSDSYVAYKYLSPNAVPNLEVLELLPADPRFFDKIVESAKYHPCRSR